jgi:hypothetical protein
MEKAEFKDSGVMYLAPNLTQQDMDTLRAGGRIANGKQGQLWFTFNLNPQVRPRKVSITD